MASAPVLMFLTQKLQGLLLLLLLGASAIPMASAARPDQHPLSGAPPSPQWGRRRPPHAGLSQSFRRSWPPHWLPVRMQRRRRCSKTWWVSWHGHASPAQGRTPEGMMLAPVWAQTRRSLSRLQRPSGFSLIREQRLAR